MSFFSESAFPLVWLTFILAGAVKGVTGMGLPTVAMGVLGAFMPPAAAASLLILPSLITNLWQCFAGPNILRQLRRFGTLLLGVLVGTMSGAPLLAGNHRWTTAGLALALMLYALYGLLGRAVRITPRAERWLSPFVGLLTGLVTGATGVFVMPAVPYLQALQIERDALVQALGLSFTVSTIALGAGLIAAGGLDGADALQSALAILPAAAGMWLGQRLRHRISASTFRRCFFAALLLLALQLLVRFFLEN